MFLILCISLFSLCKKEAQIEIITKEDLQQFKNELIQEIRSIARPVQSETKEWLRSSDVRKIYLALLALWQNQDCTDQFKISRKEVMKLSKIAAISTYHRCMKEMIGYGYFKYEPEYDSYKGSKVIFT